MSTTFDPPSGSTLTDKHARVSIVSSDTTEESQIFVRPVGTSILVAGSLEAQAIDAAGVADPGSDLVLEGLEGTEAYSKTRVVTSDGQVTYLLKRDAGWPNHTQGLYGTNSSGATIEISVIEQAPDMLAYYSVPSYGDATWTNLVAGGSDLTAPVPSEQPGGGPDNTVWIPVDPEGPQWSGENVVPIADPFTVMITASFPAGNTNVLYQASDDDNSVTDLTLYIASGIMRANLNGVEVTSAITADTVNVWAVVFTGTGVQLWKDGVMVDSDTVSSSSQDGEFTLGGQGFWVRSLKVWAIALDEGQIQTEGSSVIAQATYTVPA